MSYQRNQVVWALARTMTPNPSLAFERDVALKVQRLIDRDRATAVDPSQMGYAFLDGELPGKGTAASFTEETAFLLLLAVLLLDSGLTQSRVVRLIRDLKDGLCAQYEWIIGHTFEALRAGRSEAAWRKDLARGRFAVRPEHLSFVVTTGNLADLESTMEHRLCRSHSQLVEAIGVLSLDPRPLTSIELTNGAWRIWHLLPQAPLITRGRRPAS